MNTFFNFWCFLIVIVAHAQDHHDAAQNPGLNHLVGHVIATHDLQREMKAVLALEVHAERDLLPDHVPNLAPNQGSLGLNQNLAQGHPKTRSPDHGPSLLSREGLWLLTEKEMDPAVMEIEMMVTLMEATMTSMMIEQKTMRLIKSYHHFFFYINCCAVITLKCSFPGFAAVLERESKLSLQCMEGILLF